MPLRSKNTSGGQDFELSDDLLAWAIRHCSDIHHNRIITKSIISNALDRVRRSTKKDERKDSIALKKREHRNRVTPEQFPLFQRCLYECSQEYEIHQETEYRDGQFELTQADMIARIIEHVVLIGFHNSFYMTVGVCQVLHTYSAEQTMQIYQCLVQYTREEKELWDLRRQKSRTMDILDKRFGDLLVKDDRSKRERRYKPANHQQYYAGIFESWLDRLKPLTPSKESSQTCVVPQPTDRRLRINIPELLFEGCEPNEEQPYEMLRMHILLHPSCFSRLTEVCGLPPPGQCRNIPDFNLSQTEVVETCY